MFHNINNTSNWTGSKLKQQLALPSFLWLILKETTIDIQMETTINLKTLLE